jgi:hypothetical protein
MCARLKLAGWCATSLAVLLVSPVALGQAPDNPPRRDGAQPAANNQRPQQARDFDGVPRRDPNGARPAFGDGPPPGGGPGGPGGFGAPGPQVELVSKFDKDGNKRLDAAERTAAREYLAEEKAAGRGRRGPGGGGRRGNQNEEPPSPGPKVSSADVKSFPDAPLYDLDVVRTLFFEFENKDWEKELSDFYHTDVEVPAKLIVDGKAYQDVGVHFRGASSFFTVGEGRKRSLNLAIDFANDNQRLYGHRTLNLLNSHVDPTYLRSVLYYQAARDYLPAPKANYVRVVINGESWGIYVNAQQVNKDFTKQVFNSTKGARWKVPGSPRGDGGLTYMGEDVAEYKKRYEIKSKDDPKSWAELIKLCRVLNETPSSELEKALAPMLDIDGALKFLALENVFINSDGYWIRASDFNLYQDEHGKFHIIPHDSNETFRAPSGPGARGGGTNPGPSARGVELDPFAGSDDPKKPLLAKLLAVPSLRARYLGYVRMMAEDWLDWKKVGPLAEKYQALIAADVKVDTRKLDSLEAFTKGVAGTNAPPAESAEPGRRGPERAVISLKSFVDQRRAYLLNHSDVKKASVLRKG